MTHTEPGPEWVAAVGSALVDCNGPDGLSVAVECVLSWDKKSELRFFVTVDNGEVTGTGLGPPPVIDLVVSMSWADALEVQAGRLDPNVAFMQGRLKAAGDLGKFFEIMALTPHPGFASLVAHSAKLEAS